MQALNKGETRRVLASFAPARMNTIRLTLLCTLAAALVHADEKDGKPWPIGYSDTPLIQEGGKWKVHDIDRPRPEAE